MCPIKKDKEQLSEIPQNLYGTYLWICTFCNHYSLTCFYDWTKYERFLSRRHGKKRDHIVCELKIYHNFLGGMYQEIPVSW